MTGPMIPALSPHRAWAMVESSPDGMLLVDETGVILSVNAQVETLFGYERDELVGSHVEVLLPPRLRAAHTAHRTRYRVEPRIRAMGAGLDLRARRRDGSEFPTEISLSPISDEAGTAVIASVRDISARVARQDHVNLIQSAIDSARDGVFMYRPDTLRFTYVNQGAVDQTGYRREELQDMTPLHITPQFTRDSFLDLLSPLLEGRVPELRFRTVHRTKGGVDVPVEIVLEHPPTEDEARRVLVAVVRDISDRVAAEAERDRQQRWVDSIADVRAKLLADTATDEVLRLICRHACAIVDADSAVLAEPDGDGGPLVVVAAHGLPSSPSPVGDPADAPSPVAAALLAADHPARVLEVRPHRDGGPFDPTEVKLLESFAQQSAAALEQAQARRDRQRLALLEDRERIAEDLHDSVIQRLFAAGMGLQSILPAVTSEDAGARVQSTIDLLDTTIAELRSAILRLRPAVAPEPVVDQIRAVVADHVAQLGFRPTTHLPDDLGGTSPEVVAQLVPSLHEALSNVARHAGASQVEVRVDLREGSLVLEVTDDGVGIDPGAEEGNGMGNLRSRARRVGGSCEVREGHGCGTMVTWRVPFRPDPG